MRDGTFFRKLSGLGRVTRYDAAPFHPPVPERLMPSLSRLLKKALRVPNDLQLYQALQSGKIDRSIRITCRPRSDGGGALVHSRLSAMCFAHAAGIEYVHTPFSVVTHAEGDPDEWTRRWEDFFNLGLGETPAGDEAATDIKTLLNHPRLSRQPGLLVSALHFHGYCSRFPDAYRAVIPEFRAKYFASDKSAIALNRIEQGITVAFHIRRGDVSLSDPVTASRFTDDERLLNLAMRIKSLSQELGVPVRINIYSEGDARDFARYTDLGCELHIGDDVFTTFHNLVESDVLVMAKSAFSFVAALLSDGIKLYEPFWNAPLNDWLRVDTQGAFDEGRFRTILAERAAGEA